jgi:hypothetical protein
VNRFSAYDMLKVLEQKGLVASTYVGERPEQRIRIPGRPSISFYPLLEAARTALAHPELAGREFVRLRRRVLRAIRRHTMSSRDLMNELLAAIPSTNSPLAYCAETCTALILSLRHRLHRGMEMDQISAFLTGGHHALDLLPGFILGLSLRRPLDEELRQRLINYSTACQAYIEQLDDHARHALMRYLRDLISLLSA